MKPFVKYSQEQIEKIGNTLIYLCDNISNISKTKALKLIYILDEISIKKSGIPFLNLSYNLWKYGPVDTELFVELSNNKLHLLKSYITKDKNGYLQALQDFNDNEFSDNDIELMDYVIKQFGNDNAVELSNYTHRENSLWRNTAIKYGVLDDLIKEKINTTNIHLDMKYLIKHESWKLNRYKRYLELN